MDISHVPEWVIHLTFGGFLFYFFILYLIFSWLSRNKNNNKSSWHNFKQSFLRHYEKENI